MLADGFYDNGLITFSGAEKGKALDVYCKAEGLDYQQLLSQAQNRKLLFFKKKHPGKKPAKAELTN